MKEKDSVTFLEPWMAVDSHAEGLEKQLKREVGLGHPLHSRRVRAIARRQDCDDVLFVGMDELSKLSPLSVECILHFDPDASAFFRLNTLQLFLDFGIFARHRTDLIANFWRQRWLLKRLSKPGILEEVARHTCVYPIRHGAQVVLPGERQEVLELFAHVGA